MPSNLEVHFESSAKDYVNIQNPYGPICPFGLLLWSMKKILLSSVFAVLLSVSAWAQSTLQLSNNRTLAYETFSMDAKGPVFVFLPGIYRGYSSAEKLDQEVLNLLKQSGFPFVLMHFAEHPESVALSGKATPNYSTVDAQDLADEVSALVSHLKIKHAIPVTLSFSSVITAHLDTKMFPAVIETAPIGTNTETLSKTDLASYNSLYFMSQNPFLGRAWLNKMLEPTLRQKWTPWVEHYAERMTILQKPDYHERGMKGYLALSASSVGFDLRQQKFAKGPIRFFILGENEMPERKKVQLEAISLYEKATQNNGMVVTIPGAGHGVPTDQPRAYVDLLKQIHAGFAQ